MKSNYASLAIPASKQGELAFSLVPLLSSGGKIGVLDLFAGIGGLSSGFAKVGFDTLGVDSELVAGIVYENAGFGRALQRDLRSTSIEVKVHVLIGGPPCRPWSAVNLQRRRSTHEDHGLFMRFIEHVRDIRPLIFVMENVPALGSDDLYAHGINELRSCGYDILARVLRYEQFGASTKRRRLFTVGVWRSSGAAHTFFRLLEDQHLPARTVRDAIGRFRDLGRDEFHDHDWAEFRTIHKYKDRYATGQFGWRKLAYDLPAPSFGSVAKTYILHPESGLGVFPERVLSVREVMAIMGFADDVRFPQGTSRNTRYQMIANAVSPQVSRAIAATVHRMLTGNSLTLAK